jgi:hypothetical protein
MKTFDVHLFDGRTVHVRGTRYTHDSDQYVFWRDDAEVQWFREDTVVGITEQPQPDPQLRRWFEEQARRQRELQKGWTLNHNV